MAYERRRKLSRRIKFLREQKGLTQEEAARACRIKYRYYQECESKKPRDMRFSTMDRIAKGLGVTMSELFDFE